MARSQAKWRPRCLSASFSRICMGSRRLEPPRWWPGPGLTAPHCRLPARSRASAWEPTSARRPFWRPPSGQLQRISEILRTRGRAGRPDLGLPGAAPFCGDPRNSPKKTPAPFQRRRAGVPILESKHERIRQLPLLDGRNASRCPSMAVGFDGDRDEAVPLADVVDVDLDLPVDLLRDLVFIAGPEIDRVLRRTVIRLRKVEAGQGRVCGVRDDGIPDD